MKKYRWTKEEDEKLYEYRKNGLTCREIHELLPTRTISSIRCRIQNIGINEIFPYLDNQLIDLTGMKFGKLTVIKRAENDKTRHVRWFCDCDCGKKNIVVNKDALLSGNQVSCGCYRDNILKSAQEKRYFNQYDISKEYGVGYCHNTNNEFLFDLDDYEKIKNYCWMEDSNGYVVTFVNKKPLFMHRLVMGLDEKSPLEVDHIKHNVKDNRKLYLRAVSHSENHRNSKKYNSNSSGFTGVFLDERDGNWYSRITYNNEVINLCRSKIKEDVIRARKEAEELYFGEYSYSNSMNYNPETDSYE